MGTKYSLADANKILEERIGCALAYRKAYVSRW